jgi:hypothetical protein
MNPKLRYKTPQANCVVLTIYDGREAGPTSMLDTCVEIIDGVVGKFICTNCEGRGQPSSRQLNGSHGEKCDLCKGEGFLLVGL